MDLSSPFVFVPAYLAGVYLLVGFALFVLVDVLGSPGALAMVFRGVRHDCRVERINFWPLGAVVVLLLALWALGEWMLLWPRALWRS